MKKNEQINIKFISDDALEQIKKNIKTITELVKNDDTNSWLSREFNPPIFIEKNLTISDFELEDNPESKDKNKDFSNHIIIYEALQHLPRNVLCDERFWLWLELDKFYYQSKLMMPITSKSTFHDHWMFGQGIRRGLFFGVLSRCFFRVDLTIDLSLNDKYELTKWIVENPERFRVHSWRSFSSDKHLIRGIIKGEKRAVEELKKENTDKYTELSKYICSELGSVGFLDAISEEEIEKLVYEKTKLLMS